MANRLKILLRDIPIIGEGLLLIKYKLWFPILNIKVGFAIELTRLLRKCKIYSVNDKNIKKLKNSYSNRECIIIGNGPSLKIEDLDIIQNSGMISFGLNRIYELYDKTSWRPDFFCVQDISFINGRFAKLSGDQFIKLISNEKLKGLFVNNSVRNYLNSSLSKKNSSIYYFRMLTTPLFGTKIKDFSKNVDVSISDLGTVTSAAIQFAAYLGFKKIYLYGQDNKYNYYLNENGDFVMNNESPNYAEGLENVVYEAKNSKGIASSLGYADLRKFSIGFKKCRDYSEQNGIRIINVTRGGQLEIFEREDFDLLFYKLK